MPTYLGLKNKSTEGSREISGFQLLGTRKKFRDVHIVRADNVNQNEDDILATPGVPQLRSLSSGAFLRMKRAKEINSAARLWEVSCQYDSQLDRNKKTVDLSWETEEIEEVIEVDQVTGRPIINSVGEPLFTTAPFVIPVLVIKRIQPIFSSQTVLRYANTLNSHFFWGAPPGTALMKGPTAEEVDLDGSNFWEVTYRIKFNLKISNVNGRPILKGWLFFPLNHGTKYLENAGDDLEDAVPFRADGDNSTGNLNFNGTRRAGNQRGLYLTYNKHRVANFNRLRLGPFV